ncbi:MAG: hypothetical protein MO846_06220 [Candidatus Devosia symbiotica]|nr:hypothetical protein [Candidatus Devosia symbiotica]
MTHKPSMSREIGTALAVFAIYLLTILAPLHETCASQLVFEKLGYTTLRSGWVLRSSAGAIDQDSKVPVSKCPVTGVDKPAAIASPGIDAVLLTWCHAELAAPRPITMGTVQPAAIAPPSGPRGPPEAI